MNKTEATILCTDIGTTSLKAALIKADGTVTAYSQQAYEVEDSSKLSAGWFDALQRATGEFSDAMQTVCALCISGNGPTIVSDNGRTLLWNAKTGSAGDSSTYSRPETARTTKSLFIPRMLAFKHIFTTEWESSLLFFSGPEYLIWQLTGKAVTILPEKRYTSAYWTERELAAFAIPEKKLPLFVPPGYNVGLTIKDVTEKLRLPGQIPVFCGGPDFVVALIGTNTLENGKLCDCAGSSEGLNLCTGRPFSETEIRTLPSVMPGLWNAAVLFPESGKRFADYKADPKHHAAKEHSFADLTEKGIKNHAGEEYALMHSVAEENRKGLEILLSAAKREGIAVSSVMTITGGQAKIPEWLQLKADIMRYPIAVTGCADAELTGDAVLAWTGLGIYASVSQAAALLVKETTVYYPGT